MTPSQVCCFVLLIPTPEEYRVLRYQGLTQGSPHPNCFRLYFRRWLRRALLFLTDHSRSPGTTTRGSEWGPASAWPHQWVAPRGQGDPHFGTAACPVALRVCARDRLRPPAPPRPFVLDGPPELPRLPPAAGLPPPAPAAPASRGCWASAVAGAAPSSRGLLVPCARSAAGRPAAPSPPLARRRAATAGFAMVFAQRLRELSPARTPLSGVFCLAKSADSCRMLSLVYFGTKRKGAKTSVSPISSGVLTHYTSHTRRSEVIKVVLHVLSKPLAGQKVGDRIIAPYKSR